MIVMALAVFGVIFYLAGGTVAINSKTLPLLVGVAAVVTFLYKLLWCMANGDSPGMRWTRLTLVNFRRPAAHTYAADASPGLGRAQPMRRWSGFPVGLGGRRNAHLARSHFENVPDAVLRRVGNPPQDGILPHGYGVAFT